MIIKKKRILLIIMLILGSLLAACGKHDESLDEFTAGDLEGIVLEENTTKQNTIEQFEKGYDLPVDANQRKEAENDCRKAMELIRDIYGQSEKGDAFNIVLSDVTLLEMQDKLKNIGSSVKAGVTYSNMKNFESVDTFLRDCMEGISGSAVIYEIHSSGGIGRMKFSYDGTDMYVLSASAAWNKDNEPEITYVSYTRIKEWKYTDKGWFCYELCVPEPPEVTEIVDGSHLIRVKPMSEINREYSEKCVLGLGYQGNNLLCSNWNTENMEDLDYNGLYEYLYAMKYQEKFNSEDYPDGIPKPLFESLIMEYLPVTSEQIREYAVFDEEKQVYEWVRLGCFNYAPTYFGTSLPEVTDIKENADGTITLTVDAVCDMVLCDDAVITHELTVQFAEDGSFMYLGNEILNNGIEDIPEYQYRINSQNTSNDTDTASNALEKTYGIEEYGTVEEKRQEYFSEETGNQLYYYEMENIYINDSFPNAVSINRTLQQIYDEIEENYVETSTVHTNGDEAFGMPYTNWKVISIKYVGDDYISILYNDVYYMGGAHPYSRYDGITIDCKTGEQVSASQLLGKSDEEILAGISNAMGFDYIGTWDDVDFYLTDSTMVFFYRMPGHWDDVVLQREK